ncbi:PREDICTED: N-alpha-acetyltransferase 40 [Rhagoletis zephyria]|uniref:N-alpha-acetyltransferase 40 n=1 Tax=Rhagoletis zephyria TaxID=28612 RepID=UPI0008114C75|nr:PREDICTED: N-alpha-acetyltransferase 40 [Rhagoletis zephyria]XP_017472950.1 PREDICTED: N-alpha-acetyltransferase 40 [Rhagoletis zephyria]XP_017472951.1 PREDICTED: N-alpha-acetyltransferase 40 [Rhagoletis zephyria]XP_017472952.1 PREDICTED: N-alpha-acetyltransferase 40 [Rhagoletis zephyria]
MTNANSTTNQQRNVENAARAKNPLESVPDTSHFTAKNGAEYKLYCRAKGDMDAKTLKWAFKLAERNVSPFYKALQMGWQPKVKQNDLNKKWARYLVATDKSGESVAYTMFRFDMDYGHSVLYCYEMQIESSSQRQGLGKFMMNALEQCARHWHMDKVVLTVLKNNTNATAFFKAIGYGLDETSPDILEKAEYEILSKCI